MSDKDITDTWSYKIELIDTEGCVIRQIIRSVSAPGSFTERILYQNSTTGMSVNDGLYKIVVTAYDKYCDSSTAIYVIVKHNKPPQPVIEHSLVSNMVSIEYPPDSFPAYALKQYSYLGDNVIYGRPFLVTARGFVTAIHEDIAGNKSTVMLQVSPPRQIGENETQTGLPPVMLPESGNGGATGAGVILEETRNCYIYYINFRGGINDPAAANAILGMIN